MKDECKLSKNLPKYFLLIILLTPALVRGQRVDLDQIKLSGQYDGTLTEILNSIGNTYNIKFKFDAQAFNKFTIVDNFENKPLTHFLDYWSLIYNFKYVQNEEGLIVIKDKKVFEKEMHELKKQEEVKQQNYSGPSSESNITIAGKLVDKETGESLPFGSIIVIGTRHGTSTNADGLFTLQNIPTDTSTILFSYTGYAQKSIKLNPFSSHKYLVAEMENYSRQLSEVVISTQREDALKTNENISTISMNPQSLAKLPNVGERDIMRAFQLMPGVSASNESSSGLYVRGGTPDQNLILYDGFTIYHVDHLYGFFSAFNANAIKDVRLYKGGYESRFGGRLSSVMEITGKDGNANKITAGGNIGLLSMNAYAEVPIGKKITTLFAFRKSWKGPLYNKIFNLYNSSSTGNNSNTNTNQGSVPSRPGGPGGSGGPDFSTTVRSYFYDLNGKITFRPTTKDVVSFSLFNGIDNLDNSQDLNSSGFSGFGGQNFSFSSTTHDLTNYGNTGLSLKWSRKWTDKLYVHALVSQSHYFSDRNRSTETSTSFQGPSGGANPASSGIIENNNLKDRSAQVNLAYQATEKFEILSGLFYTKYDITYNYGTNDTTTLIDRKNIGSLQGVYLQGKMKFMGQRVTITPGVRVSSYDVTKQLYQEPRLSVNYKLTDRINLTGAAGRYYQFANRVIREDILAGSRDFWVLSDGKSVKVSHADHLIGGFNYETRSKLFSVEGYHKKYSNLSEYTLRFESDLRSGTSYNENFYTGQGYAQGVEFLAQQKTGRLKGWASYTLAQVRNQFDVYGKSYFPAAQDVRHEIKFVAMYNVRRWDFSTTYIYATGRPYTAPLGGYQLTLLDGSTRDYVAVGAKNTMRLPYYGRVDASIAFELQNHGGENIGNISVSVFNVLNRKNVWYKEFQVSNGAVVETNVTYLGITPNIMLSLKL